MYKICKTEQSQQRQRDFQNGLLAMMERKPYRKITISDLCREIDVPRKAFYRYFDELDDVLESYIDYLHREAFVYLYAKETLQIRNYFYYWKNHTRILNLLSDNGLRNLFMEVALKLVEENYKENEDIDKLIRVSGQVTMITTIVLLWNSNGMQQSVEEMEKIMFNCFDKYDY